MVYVINMYEHIKNIKNIPIIYYEYTMPRLEYLKVC